MFKLFKVVTRSLLLNLCLTILYVAFAAANQTGSKLNFTEAEKAWLAQGHVVHARVGAAPPLHFDENGLKGMSIDYLNLVAQRAGFRVEYIAGIPWSKALQDIQDRKNIDLILTAQVTPERKEFLAFTKTYIQAPTVIFNRTDSSFVGDIEDLFEKTVVAERSYLIQKLLIQRYPQITLLTAATSDDALKLLAAGDADAYVGSLLVGTYLIKDNGLINLKVAAPAPFEDSQQSMAIRNDWPELSSIIDKTLATITPEEHTVITDRWLPPIRFEYGISSWDVFRWVSGSSAVLLTIIFIIYYWSKKLAIEVTDRKKAEEELLKSRDYIYEITNSIGDIVLSVGIPDRKIEWVNNSIRSIGYEPSECIGETTYLFYQDEKAFSNFGDVLKKAVAEDKDILHTENILKKKNGESFPAEITVTFHKVNNEIVSVIAVLRDVTERKEVEEERIKLEEQLHQSQKVESIGRLAGGVAHDYNNMLSVIIGNVELAQIKAELSKPVDDNLDQILHAANRSRDITRQLLAFARKQIIKPKVLDLNEAVQNMLNMLRNLLGENIDLRWQPKEDIGSVKLDPSQLDQVLANLCLNARDAIADVGKMTIETDTVCLDEDYCKDHPGFNPGNYVLLSISDDGCGMDKETLDNIFEPFFTTKETGEGTGLGMAMVYGIVKQSSGFINVYSEPEQGTTFKMYFPCYEEEGDVSQEPIVGEIQKGQGETVLLVEDEAALLELTSEMLADLGYKVLAANSPLDALNQVKELPGDIDLLLTDVVMPEMNGKELSEKLLETNPDMKVLFMSGYTANVIAHHGVLDEGINFIQKPFSRHDLSMHVSQSLNSNS